MDFITLAFNPLTRMNEVKRYSSVHQEDDETLAEHVCEVGIMGYLLIDSLNKLGENISVGTFLEKTLLHDADEVITGDIPRNTKYATTEVHRELNAVADEVIKMIEHTLSISMFDPWNEAKRGKEGVILKIVDMLCVVKKSITEIELRGNLSFLKVVTELGSHLDHMVSNTEVMSVFEKPDSREFLCNIIRQARDEITTIRVKYQHMIDKYRIFENVIRGE